MTTNENKKPVHEIRIGSVKAAIWERPTESGDVFYSVTVSRLYRKDDKWNFTDSFRPHDLLILAKVLDQTHTAIIGMQPPWQDAEAAE
jgi:hypothetical protein